ncbi:TylF/MycF/NovP-related O-methyltransferase [Alteromonas sp. ASW11-130]|uniref:TylF/MycF/NovP-related O-methyltransferase n=1 Tax=Alteromonas sp. ASW11-130 TaxID=3015775 RepID=UPI0022421CE1|nr:TylF/MycF/NovP-related O-methyltransferase [Alteromonas sp. ASW11-130]MCW8091221.1 TylF/MycF family methyltransferase [Alteromonas sp. ASW11-130]
MIPPTNYVANLKLANSAALIPGAVVECGTWKGGMIAGIAKLLGKNRDYYLFDSFEGLPPVDPIDGQAAKRWQEDIDSPAYFDNCSAAEIEAITAMSLAEINDANVVKGWFEDTLPQASFPNGIAILRMDGDWYKSTYQILDSLFPLVNDNGLIIIDDYYTWDGCSKAVHDYLSKYQRPERLSSYEGVCFIRKKKAEQDKLTE